MDAKIALLPGDGIGRKCRPGRTALRAVAKRGGHTFRFVTCPIGGCAIDQFGDPLPNSTLEDCRSSQAILLVRSAGRSGRSPGEDAPEAGLLRIRKELNLFANLRPITTHRQLVDASPLKRSVVEGVDILFTEN